MITRNYKIVLLLLLSLLALTCKRQKDTDVSPVSVHSVVVPEEYTMDDASYDLTLDLKGKSGIASDDAIVFKLVGGAELVYPISQIREGVSLSVVADERITTGYYTLFLLHEGRRYYLGQTAISLQSTIEIDPAAGVNLYGAVICEGKGVPGVVVSDGREVVVTDAQGVYQMTSQKRWRYVFVSVPSGYEVPLQGVLPEFSAATSGDVSEVERRDFYLKKVDNNSFTLLVLGDMHLADRNSDREQFSHIAEDINATIAATQGPKYALTLGDMTWDQFWYSRNYTFPEYIKEMNLYFTGLPVYHTMGNHDNDMNATGDFAKAFRYTRDICPTFYSFNIGQIHFVVLDNINFYDVVSNEESGEDHRGDYVANITAEQIAWLEKDLAYVPKGSKLVISSHAPVFGHSGATGWVYRMVNSRGEGEYTSEPFVNFLVGYDVQMLTGHTHNNFHHTAPDRVFSEHNVAAVCGGWWWSGKLSPGIHLSTDGTPGGYAVYTFNGSSMTHYYKSSGWPATHQFRAYDMGKVKEVIVPSLGSNKAGFQKFVDSMQSFNDNDILINVWNWQQGWTISVTEDGTPLVATPVTARDPLHVSAMTAKRFKSVDSPNFLTDVWCHFFKATAASRNSTVTISVTDQFGNTSTEVMHRPKPFVESDYKTF